LVEWELKWVSVCFLLDESKAEITRSFRIFDIFRVELDGNILTRISPLTIIIILNELFRNYDDYLTRLFRIAVR
jgi:hypothetical protein